MKLRDWLPPVPGPGGGALRWAQACVLVFAFALPFSLALTEAALLAGLLALIVSRLRGRPFGFERSWLEPASLALVGSWLLASAFSSEPAASFYNVRKLYALGIIWLVAETTREPRVRGRVVPAILGGALLTAVVGFLIYAVMVQRSPEYRLQSLLSNQMTSAGVLAAASLWGLGEAIAGRGRRRWLAASALLPLLLALALTQTRSHWLGFACGAAVIVVSLAPRWGWTLPAGAALALWLGPARLTTRFASIFDPHEPGNQGRLSMWRSARDVIRDHPVVGVGCQDLLALYRRYRYPDWTFESGHFHNNWIQVTVMSGMIGLGVLLAWHAAALRQLWRARRAATGVDRGRAAAALAVLTAMIVAGLFDFTFGDAEVIFHSYLALGLALAILPPRAAAPPRA